MSGFSSDAGRITVWRFREAPKSLQLLSTHGGDEDWLAVAPRATASGVDDDWPSDDPNSDDWHDDAYCLPGWLWPGTAFGVCHVSVQRHPNFPESHVVVIGAHA